MCWKKNVFSYFVWFIYLLAVGVGLIGLINAACEYMEIEVYYGLAAGAVCAALSGAAVCFLHRLAAAREAAGKGNRSAGAVAEALLAVILLAVGLILRINGLDAGGQKAAYFETASVFPGQGVPWIAQGAVYLYVCFLHTVFYFVGNKMIAGIFCQILLQLLAVFLLYFAVRSCVGRIGGMVFLCLCMLSAYLSGEALMLSPEMLYLVVWAAVLLGVVMTGRRSFRVWEYFLTGILLAAACYLDVAGVILLPMAWAVIFRRRKEDPGAGKKAAACAMCMLGLFAGTAGLAGADAALSARPYFEVLLTWAGLYRPEGVQMPVALGEARFPTEYLLLAWLLSFGIFGFWRDRKSDYRKGWALMFGAAVLLSVFGCFTSDLPTGIFLYLLLAVLAGVSVEESFRPGRTVKVLSEKPHEETEPVKPENCAEEKPKAGEIQFIENPLPLPKKHVRRSLDYSIPNRSPEDDFDLAVDENDDFDI